MPDLLIARPEVAGSSPSLAFLRALEAERDSVEEIVEPALESLVLGDGCRQPTKGRCRILAAEERFDMRELSSGEERANPLAHRLDPLPGLLALLVLTPDDAEDVVVDERDDLELFELPNRQLSHGGERLFEVAEPVWPEPRLALL